MILRLGILLEFPQLPLNGMLVHCGVKPPSHFNWLPLEFCVTYLYPWLMRGNVVTKCLAHKRNALTHLWLEARSCDQKFDTPQVYHESQINQIQSIVP